ncbi:MAG TPA: hypothetical protein VH092_37840 [Urbifossiella sp.]|nr:hypothetical protein [Urbifossiella sp.]
MPLPPRRVSTDPGKATLGAAAAELGQQAGMPITVPPDAAAKPCAPVKDAPFWEALDRLAAGAGLRVAVRDAGRAVELVPKGASREVASTAGPFRVVARQVIGRALLAEGLTVHEVQIDFHWEPRYPVLRIDSYPHVTHAADDRGVALQPQAAGGKTQPTGSVHSASVKLGGVTRAAKRIGVLKGHFSVTASEKLLAFQFKLPAAKAPPAVQEKEKVGAVLKSWKKEDDTWEAEVELAYPPTLPEFESFEAPSLTAANQVRLVGPGGKAFTPDSQAVNVAGRRVSATYYFKEDRAKGLIGPLGGDWAIELDVASTPLEFRVPFELRDVPLP